MGKTKDVQYWGRICKIQSDLDHVVHYSDALCCPFCLLYNPTPPEDIVQCSEASKTNPTRIPTSSSSKPKPASRSTTNTREIVELLSSEDDTSEDEKGAMSVSERFGAVFPAGTIANRARHIQNTKDKTKEQLAGPLRDASSPPISQQALTATTQATQYLTRYRLSVQLIIGRYYYEEDDIDNCRKFTWKKKGILFELLYYIHLHYYIYTSNFTALYNTNYTLLLRFCNDNYTPRLQSIVWTTFYRPCSYCYRRSRSYPASTQRSHVHCLPIQREERPYPYCYKLLR